MTTFVDTSVLLSGHDASDQDPVVVVVRSAQQMLREGLGESESGNFEKKFAEKYYSQEWANIFDLMLGNTSVIFKRLAAEEGQVESIGRISKTAEGYFDVVLSLLSKMESVEEVVERIEKFIDTIIITEPRGSSNAVSILKLRLLTTLFNFLSVRVQLRFVVIRGLCRFARENPKIASQVFALVKDTDWWISQYEWEISNEEKFEIFAEIADIASSKIHYMQQQFAVKPSEELKTQIAVASLKDETVFEFTSSTPGMVGKCITLLNSSTLTMGEFKTFLASADGQSFLKMNQLIDESLCEKARVMIVRNAAANEPTRRVSISKLPIDSEDPFGVVVKAIRAGLISGSINEVDGLLEVLAVKPAAGEIAGQWNNAKHNLAKLCAATRRRIIE